MTSPCKRLFVFPSARRFAADQRGVSAVEFAMLLPLMLTLYLGGTEISDAVSADRKNTLVAHSVGDLVAAVSNVQSSDMTDVFTADQWVAYPYPAKNLKSSVASVCVDKTGKATISWSMASDGSVPYAQGSTVTLPPALVNPPPSTTISFIWGQSTYSYKPIIGYAITGPINMKDQFYLSPRQSCSVTLNGSSGCC